MLRDAPALMKKHPDRRTGQDRVHNVHKPYSSGINSAASILIKLSLFYPADPVMILLPQS